MPEVTPTPQRELRTLTTTLEVRTREADDPSEPGWLEGYAAVFNQDADIAGLWKERIRPGAFTDTLKRGDLVFALWNHDPSQVLARNVKPDGTRGGLRMHEDRSGLKVSIRPYDTPTGREVLTLVREGGIDKMSFAFTVEDEVWSRKDGVDVREITRVRLHDVSPVTFPAYPQTSAQVRAVVDGFRRVQVEDVSKSISREVEERQRVALSVLRKLHVDFEDYLNQLHLHL